jgi:hypothetical protein
LHVASWTPVFGPETNAPGDREAVSADEHPNASNTTPPHAARLPSNVNFDRALPVMATILMFESIFITPTSVPQTRSQ